MNYHPPIYPNNTYHIFNEAVGNEKIFLCDEDYRQFLIRYFKHILPVAETLGWTLSPTHFEFLIRTRTNEHIASHYRKMKYLPCGNYDKLPEFIMERFSNWLNSYTKSFNIKQQRKGGLFADYLKREIVEDGQQIKSKLIEIHTSPLHNGLCNKLQDWPWSSYSQLLHNSFSHIPDHEIWEIFGSKNNFIHQHQQFAMNGKMFNAR